MRYKFYKLETKEEILRILQEYNNSFVEPTDSRVGDLEQYAMKLIDTAEVYTLKDENIECGAVVFYANDFYSMTSYLTMIVVDDKCRGRGLGSLLLALCEEKSKIVGMTRLLLEVDIRNKKAIEFYKRNGFLKLKDATNYTIYMDKEL